ncbi:hypothetical protein C8R43DRAFT_1230812 [Mycena crocata]|nr:hypothetical protein C8R43DRAFT_1230812 [Mycena crocata]
MDPEGYYADPGYESDTGPRDNPMHANFRNGQPVEKVILVGHTKKVLNRGGRAICRIAFAHNWKLEAIALIFGVSASSVSRAVENIRLPRDRVGEDLKRASLVDFEYSLPFPQPAISDTAPFKPRQWDTIDPSEDESDDESDEDKPTNAQYPILGLPRLAKAECNSLIRKLNTDEDEEISSNSSQKRSYQEMVSSTAQSVGNQTGTSVSTAKRGRYSASSDSIELFGPSPPPPNQAPLVSIFASLHPPPRQNAYIANQLQNLAPVQHAPSQPQAKTLPKPSMPPDPQPAQSIPQSRSPSQPQSVTAPLPLPSRAIRTSLPPTPPLAAFLKKIVKGGVDLSGYHGLLDAQGFSVARLHTMATWRRKFIQEALTRLLMGAEPAAVGHKGMGSFEHISLEIAIWKLKTPTSAPPPGRLPLPPASNPHNSGATLASLLKNVMGLDLSAYHDLMAAQGYDVPRLSAVATWDTEEIQHILSRSLRGTETAVGGQRGMKGLEVLALEFSLRPE